MKIHMKNPSEKPSIVPISKTLASSLQAESESFHFISKSESSILKTINFPMLDLVLIPTDKKYREST